MDKFNLKDWVDGIKSAEDAYFTDLPYSDDFFVLTLTNNKRHAYPVDVWKRPDAYDWDYFDRLVENNQIPSSIPDIGYFVLRNSSKLTDIIRSHSASDFLSDSLLLSPKAKNAFSDCNAKQKGFYPTKVELKGKGNSDYYLFKYSATANDFIDYHKSTFYSQDDLLDFDTRKIVELNSLKEIEDYSISNDVYVFAKQIVFTSDFPDYDIFRMTGQFGLHEIFVSKNLATKLKDMTGVTLGRTSRLSR